MKPSKADWMCPATGTPITIAWLAIVAHLRRSGRHLIPTSRRFSSHALNDH